MGSPRLPVLGLLALLLSLGLTTAAAAGPTRVASDPTPEPGQSVTPSPDITTPPPPPTTSPPPPTTPPPVPTSAAPVPTSAPPRPTVRPSVTPAPSVAPAPGGTPPFSGPPPAFLGPSVGPLSSPTALSTSPALIEPRAVQGSSPVPGSSSSSSPGIPATAGRFAAVPPSEPPDGRPLTPWVAAGAVLSLAGLWTAFTVLRPRLGTPVVAGVSVASVVLGTGLALKPLTDPPPSLVVGTYVVGGSACRTGDLPVTGGFANRPTSAGPLVDAPRGATWVAGASGSAVVCLQLDKKVPSSVRTATPTDDPLQARVSCRTSEQLLGGGFAVPNGRSGPHGSHPAPTKQWVAAVGSRADAPPGWPAVAAMCAQLPGGLFTYVAEGGITSVGSALAACSPGDVVLNGGYGGAQVRGSHPVDGGWQVELGEGGGSAYALCTHPGHDLGITKTSVRQASGTGQAVATCEPGTRVLGGGWTSGTGLGRLLRFAPAGNGWVAALPTQGEVTAYALCLRRAG